MSPARLQLRRGVKGWRLPEGGKSVGRGTRWGNPFTVKEYGLAEALRLFRERVLADPEYRRGVREQLAGRDLACWCPLDQECHGDLLLEIANGGGR